MVLPPGKEPDEEARRRALAGLETIFNKTQLLRPEERSHASLEVPPPWRDTASEVLI